MDKADLVSQWRELYQAETEISRAPFFYYEPWGQQPDFHSSRARFRLVIGGNRVGKTTCGIIEDLNHLLGFRFDGSKDGLPKPPIRGLLMISDRAKVETVVMPKIMEFCPPSWITHIKNGNDGNPQVLTFKNGSRYHIHSYMQDPDTQESTDWDFAHFDEPPPRPVWIAVTRGLVDRNRPAWITFTPKSCPWIYTELYLKADGRKIAVFSMSLRDNPYIAASAKQDFIDSLHPDEIPCRVDGKFSNLEGVIFREFRRDIHVLPAHLPPEGTPVFMTMDPHDRRPSYIMWAYMDARERIVIFDEWPNEPFWELKTSRMSVRDYVAMIRTREGRRIRPYERIMDPNFAETASHISGGTVAEEYAFHGMDFFTGINNDIPLGHSRIHERLAHENQEPGLFVTENCTNMIWALETYSWRSKDIEGEYSARERPSEEGKDPIDALRYLLDYEPSPSMTLNDTFEAAQPFSPDDYGAGYG